MNEKVIKYIRRQDAGWKQAAGCSGETSINLSNEIFAFLTFGLVDGGEECGIAFKLYKEDFLEALSFIKTQLPLYRSTSKSSELISENHPIFLKLITSVNGYFKGNDVADYAVTLYRRRDGRIYLKNLKQESFTIRDFLVEFSSALEFEMTADGFDLRIRSAVNEIV